MFSYKLPPIPLILGSLLFCQTTLAEDRALIIGVGEYMESSANLNGIDIDADAANQMAQMMGFKTNQIKTLMDSQATAENVVKTIQSWLIRGTTANDRVFLYFSGHGTQVYDESGDETDDQRDEALLMHDARLITVDNQKTITGILLDDDMNTLIEHIPSKNVLVLIDACHSGSATRSLTLNPRFSGSNMQGVSKYYNWPNMSPASSSSSRNLTPESFITKDNTATNFISIAAAGDQEQSIATEKGSIFTLGLLDTVKQAYQKKLTLTPSILHEVTHGFVKRTMEGSGKEFFPVLSPKNSSLANRSLRVEETASMVSAGTQHGPIWTKLVNSVKKLEPINMSLNQKNYVEGDLLKISLTIPADGGYLNVVSVDQEDNATVLYPNKLNKNNYLKGGKLIIPTPEMPFNLEARAPYGESVVVAIYTKTELNFFESGKGQRNNMGDLEDTLAELSAESYRSFSVAEKKKVPAMGALVVTKISQ